MPAGSDFDPHAAGARTPAGPPELTRRESEVLSLLVVGYTDREVADALGISKSTAHFHAETLKRKFAARNRTHLAALAVAAGAVTLR